MRNNEYPRGRNCDREKKVFSLFQRATRRVAEALGREQGQFGKDEKRKVEEIDNYTTGLRNATLDFSVNTRRT